MLTHVSVFKKKIVTADLSSEVSSEEKYWSQDFFFPVSFFKMQRGKKPNCGCLRVIIYSDLKSTIYTVIYTNLQKS
jgi:hypothetical protein